MTAWVRFKKKEMPGGLWLKCPACGEVIYKKDLEENLKVCPKCEHHHTLNALERVQTILDEGSAEEMCVDMEAVDRLDFEDKSKYSEKLVKTMAKTKRKEAIWIGTGKVMGLDVAFGTLDFSFLGGSMGVVVGEKIAILVEYALEKDLPLIMVASSGGARMHEGALSLMQMAKTCNSLGRLNKAGKLYISILGNPTTGGVTASWATQADVIIAEPGALIGFAGPRVIKTTLRQDLPKGFQRSEFLIERGQIDTIIHRNKLRESIDEIISFCLLDHKNTSARKYKQVASGKKQNSSKAKQAGAANGSSRSEAVEVGADNKKAAKAKKNNSKAKAKKKDAKKTEKNKEDEKQ